MRNAGWVRPRSGQAPPAQRALIRTLWTFLTAAALLLALVGVRPASDPGSVAPVDYSSPKVGPRLVDGQLTVGGQPFLPRGFNMIGLLAPAWCRSGQAPLAASHFGAAELDAAKAWNANTLRFQVSQRGLADPGVASADRAAYLAQVVAGVQLARSHGFFVIVSLQDQSNGCGPAHPLPTSTSVAAWQVLAPALMNDAGVLFELFNEPNVDATSAGWLQWRDGGAGATTNLGDTSVGQQALVDQVRALGAKNVLIADVLDKGEKMNGLLPLTDSGSQLMYGIHPYFFDNGLTWWNDKFGTASATYPVVATEWNFRSGDCGTAKASLAVDFLAYLRSHRIGLLAHAFDVPGTTITSDWLWTPTDCAGSQGGSGKLTKDYFTGQTDPDPGVGQVAALTALATHPDRVNLSWQAATGPVDHYDVLRDGVVVASPTGLQFEDTGLTADADHAYRVQAVDDTGEAGPPSDEVVAHTPAEEDVDPPTAPGKPEVTDLAVDHVSLAWAAATDAVGVVGYDVLRDGDTVATTDGQTRTFTDAHVTPGASYHYTVVARDAAGNPSPGSDGADVEVPTPDTTPPGAPTGLLASWSSSTGSTLSWDVDTDDDTGVTGYLVDRDGTTIGSPTGTTFKDTAPLPPGSHSYVVRAVDAAGNVSAGSTPAGVVVPAPRDTTAPSIPTRVAAAVLAPTRSRVTWAASTDSTGVTGYRVTRDGTRIATVAETSFVDAAMPAGAKHVYRVSAVDAAGNASAASVAATVTAPAAAANGLTGKYYDTATFGTLKLTRVDPTIDFTWGTGAPATGMGADTFSVRWTGNVIPLSAETYTFYLQSDEGARLWINGQLLVDDWTLHSLREKKATIALAPTQAYSVKVEFRDNTKSAAVRLAWSTPTIAKADVPTAQLLSK
jgi:fibronectin type 3 domain-containing protein